MNKNLYGFLFFLLLAWNISAQTNEEWALLDSRIEEATERLMPIISENEFRIFARRYLQIKNRFDREGMTDAISTEITELSSDLLAQINEDEELLSYFPEITNTREKAIEAQAQIYASESLQRADQGLSALRRAQVSSDLDDRQLFVNQTVENYLNVELQAIIQNNLGTAISLLNRARSSGVQILSEATLSSGEELLNQARQTITENRYQLDGAIRLRELAIIEISKAINIARQIQDFRSRGLSEEELLLELSNPLVNIAEDLGIEYDYLRTAEEVSLQIRELISATIENNDETVIISERQREQLNALENEIRLLNEEMQEGIDERNNLIRELEALNAVNRTFDQLELIFNPDEATIIRENNDLVIRLMGISFDSGSSNISQTDNPVFQKIAQAINLFPNAIVLIEGHTDSTGNYDSNLQLSQLRAEAVQLLLENDFSISSYQMTSIGYGEIRPIANNETSLGREQNRRIEVRIALTP
jgi:OOP family OmpA-OmpF porin